MRSSSSALGYDMMMPNSHDVWVCTRRKSLAMNDEYFSIALERAAKFLDALSVRHQFRPAHFQIVEGFHTRPVRPSVA
jgi:hypothetical protein